MFARAFFAAALVAVAAAAPEGRKPEECKDVPVVTVPDVTVVANSKICSPLPAGVCGSGVMVANVTYELNCAFGCPTTTTIWCEGNAIVDEKKKTCASKYWFCCGKDCKGMPEERKCEYEGKEYTVGVAYDLGNGKTMWCVDEETPVTCTGKECGSTLELTPPRVETCPAPPKPLPPKPHPEPECRRDKDCKCPFGLACECKHGKCVPAQEPEPECRVDRDCRCPFDLACECKHGKCVPAQDPNQCHHDRDCPPVNGVAFECKHGHCVPAQDPNQCHRDSDCPKVNGLAFECKHGHCVPAEGPKPDDKFPVCRGDQDCPTNHACVNFHCQAPKQCHQNRDCPSVNGLAFDCKNGQCVPAEGPFPDNEFSYCRGDQDCPTNHACVRGQCQAPKQCHQPRDCPSVNGVKFECMRGQCVPAEGPNPDEQFSYCRSNNDCAGACGDMACLCVKGMCKPDPKFAN